MRINYLSLKIRLVIWLMGWMGNFMLRLNQKYFYGDLYSLGDLTIKNKNQSLTKSKSATVFFNC
jgi:hypothetical protein